MCTCSQNQNRNRVRNGRIESAPGATAALEMATQGRLGAAKGQNGRLSLPRRCSGARNGCSRLPRGCQGAQKLPCGPFWEPDGALGLPRNRKSAQNNNSRLPRRHRGAVRSKVLLKGAVSTRLFLASLFPYGFPCVTVLVEVRYVTSK